MVFAPNAATVFADGPLAVPQRPDKAEIRRLFAQYEAAIDAYSSGAGSIAKATKDFLLADLMHDADVMAWVYADATVSNNGIYKKSGAAGAGSWTLILPLPYSFILAENSGAGTANAIEASTSTPVSTAALVLLNILETNTTGSVTVRFNEGDAVYTIKTNSGNDVAAGGLISGMLVIGCLSGSIFRLVSDQASAAIIAQAEYAAGRAEIARDEALAAQPNSFPMSRSILKALDPNIVTSAYLKELGREGQFVWRDGDYTTRIALDEREGIFIKSDTVAASSGAWVRIFAPRATYSVDWWGTAKDGTSDDAAAFNAARAVVSSLGGGWIEASAGTYFLAATIIGASGVYWRGAGGMQTTLQRTGSYGHTFRQTGGYGKIFDFHFSHSVIPNPGATSIDNRLTDATAHVYLLQTQNFEIVGNRFARMPFGIKHDGAVNTHIDYNWFIGWWDAQNVAGQEGVADIGFFGTNAHGQLCKITRNYFSGAYNGVRNHTFSNGGNSVTSSIGYNTGRKNAIFASSIEDLEISNNYFGRNSESLIRLAHTGGANDILIDIRVRGNLFDNAGNGFHHITVESLVAGKYTLGLSVTGNTFNGEYDSISCLLATGVGSSPSLVNLTFSGNSIFAMVGCPIVLTGVYGGVVAGNSIQAYNCLNVGLAATGTSEYKAGVYIGGVSDDCLVHGNKIGGGGNDANPLAANYCYEGVTIVSASGKFNYERDNVLTLKDASGNARRGISGGATRTINSGGATRAQDRIVFVANTTGAAMSVSLPDYPVPGQTITIKDAGGNAGTYLIQVLPGAGSTQIDGVSNSNITTNFGTKNFVFNGFQWNVF